MNSGTFPNMLCLCVIVKTKILVKILSELPFSFSNCEIPHNPASFRFSTFQFVYETNENGNRVVLGKGTYGMVYAGRDLSNQVRIAIKEIPEKDST